MSDVGVEHPPKRRVSTTEAELRGQDARQLAGGKSQGGSALRLHVVDRHRHGWPLDCVELDGELLQRHVDSTRPRTWAADERRLALEPPFVWHLRREPEVLRGDIRNQQVLRELQSLCTSAHARRASQAGVHRATLEVVPRACEWRGHDCVACKRIAASAGLSGRP